MVSKIDQLKRKHEKLQVEQKQVQAKIQALEAGEKTRERKRDTRRKILIGAYYFDKANSEDRWEDVVKLMDGYLSRESDRVLFGLEKREMKAFVQSVERCDGEEVSSEIDTVI